MTTDIATAETQQILQVFVVKTSTIYPYDATQKEHVGIYGVYNTREKAEVACEECKTNTYADVVAEIETYDVE